MSQSSGPNEPISAADALPPVEPPSAGFIVQLFVVPGIIVVIIVMVWLVFNWVARTSNDPQEYKRALHRDHASRWQAAVNLANALRVDDAQGRQLRQDSELARELASILTKEIESGGNQKEGLKLQIYLCRALGEFQIDDGLTALLKAANISDTDEKTEVRLAALQAIALLAQNLREASHGELADNQQVCEVLLSAAQDQNPRVRSVAAYAMGAVGGDQLLPTLEKMLADSYPDARYNAATWLGSRGNAQSLAVLLEMIDPDELQGVDLEKEEGSKEYKRAVLMTNALGAFDRLADKNSEVDLTPVVEQLERLLDQNLAPKIQNQAPDKNSESDSTLFDEGESMEDMVKHASEESDRLSKKPLNPQIKVQATALLKKLKGRPVPAKAA